MKHFFIILFAIISNSAFTQKRINFLPENMYPYDGYYINLENLERIEADGILATTFKSASKYSSRFAQPHWFESEIIKVSYQDRFFERTDDNQVKITDFSGKLIKLLPNKEKGHEMDNVSNGHLLLSTSHGVVHIKRMGGEIGFVVYKYDEGGEVSYKKQFNHTDIKINGNTHHYNPYLHYFKHTNNHVVFTSYDDKYPTTTVLNVKTGTLKEYDFITGGIIRSEDEQSIIGLMEMDEENKLIKAHFRAHKWQTDMNNSYHDGSETLIHGNTFVVAHYANISTGSAMAAYDVKTGKLLWKADVRQLMVGHSKYYNAVRLSLFKNKLIMEGTEAYGHYLQIFDITNGKKLFDGQDQEIKD
jgi:hypothetical protein